MKQMVASDSGVSTLFGNDRFLETLRSHSQKEAKNNRSLQESEQHQLDSLAIWSNDASISPNEPIADFFPDWASHTQSPRVRLEIASCLPKLPDKWRLATAKRLLSRSEDHHDRMQPLMIWYGIEPLVTAYPQQAAELAIDGKMPKVSRLIARRLAEEIDNPKVAGELLRIIAKSPSKLEVMTGVADALRGRRKVKKPAGWDVAVSGLGSGETGKLLEEIGVIFGDGQSLEQIRRVATNGNADPLMRGKAILTLAENRFKGLLVLLNKNFNDKKVRLYVIEAYAFCDDPKIAGKLINQFGNLKPASQNAAINTLTKRAAWAIELLDAVEKGRIDKTYITAWHARQIDNLGDTRLSGKLLLAWGTIRKSSNEKRKEIEDLQSQLANLKLDNIDVEKGRALFEKSCANCHVLYGKGGLIGPDLTGGNRRDLGYLLENILDPSSSVAESFRSSIVDLTDGRTLTGVILNQNENVLQLQTSEKKLVIDRGEIEQIKPTRNSLMPEGLLNSLNPKQRRNLIGYLMLN